MFFIFSSEIFVGICQDSETQPLVGQDGCFCAFFVQYSKKNNTRVSMREFYDKVRLKQVCSASKNIVWHDACLVQ